jgi:cytochrome c oxidase subunit 2
LLIVLDARTQADYEKWVLDQKSAVKQQKGVTLKPKVNLNKHWTPQELLQRGREVYNDNCAVCHKPDGTGMPPAFPAVKGSRVVTGPFKEQVDIVLNGKNAMPAWGLQLNDDDIAAVITYERNSWGNEDKKIHGSLAGGVVMPTDVSAERKK